MKEITYDRHFEEKLFKTAREAPGGKRRGTGRHAAKKGLVFFSRPTVVAGPCPE